MSYDERDAAFDEMYEQIGRELYPDHKVQAINEFTAERLRSFYISNPRVMRPAVDALQEGKLLFNSSHHSAAVVFFVTAIELLLKATVLKPVVHGLIHIEGLANIVVQQTLGQTGFERYEKLLSQLYSELAGIELKSIERNGSKEKLLAECKSLQELRNKIIHQGATCGPEQAKLGLNVSVAVYELIVRPMLFKLGLTVIEEGVIQPRSNM
ncbi:hypothetical protein KI811_14830 [Geobacter hydrogenophilus]|uniref:Uncharacterized protein n=1 Tax=Geobacter hydrogenophilus TaxID=40983 RepID=A0A9W6FXX4_9BACT|nr:hypothetical protein [Geobacter hydrogenophilus]MBT0895086.1 hypothetical protein [Geobacter hydrogenophilus]GLI36911.1 hypothetical protein GHYDROH2_04120 [Geobacter hydrogenophilus]